MESSETIQIDYVFQCTSGEATGREIKFPVVLDALSLDRRNLRTETLPDWTQLEYQQCSGCPLGTDKHPRCPAAISLAEIGDAFGGIHSYTEATVTVTTPEKMIQKDTSVQKGLSSLMGLLLATSGCPGLARFKPLARFHLPFATREDTIIRMIGSYFTAQYLLASDTEGDGMGLDELRAWYDEVHRINKMLSDRVGDAWQGDAGSNALVLLDVLAQELPLSIDDQLREMKPWFAAYFKASSS